MHKLDISASTDYVSGYLRYGHYEGEIFLMTKNLKSLKEIQQNF